MRDVTETGNIVKTADGAEADGRLLKEKACTVKILPTGDTWYGMTYREDADAVKAAFAKMAGEGTYPEELYSDL